MAEIGSIVDGKYEVLKMIGKGGMSKVYLAMDKRLNKQWALKEITKKAHDKNNEVVIQSAIAEANMIKSLDHPTLPRIVDIIDEPDVIYVVMDYIEGETLSTLVKQGAQPQDTVIDWGKQLCSVLDYLHTRQPAIIYRDMKPGNIMLKPDGTIKLIDFGIAREYKEQNLADTVSLGTKGYAAPEQFGGKGQTDARTDIYCLGVTLHHLLTGHSPTDPPYELYPIRQYNANLSAGLEEIIQKCIQLNPADRYQSSAELLYALEHYEDGDNLHKKVLKKKLIGFSAILAASVVFLAVGITGRVLKLQTNNADYDKVIAKAEKASTSQQQIEYYCDAIDIKPNTLTAYEGMVSAMKEDAVFTVEEEGVLKREINDNLVSIKKDEGYSRLAFDIGKLYWYNYDYGVTDTNADNSVTRMKSSIQWFEDAVTYGDSTSEYYNMSKIYSDIGTFNKDITLNIQEATDKGEYINYWNNLKSMSEFLVNTNENNELVLLEAYGIILNSMESYARKFMTDGVPNTDMENMYKNAVTVINGIDVSNSETLEQKKRTVTSRITTGAIRTALEKAYGTINLD